MGIGYLVLTLYSKEMTEVHSPLSWRYPGTPFILTYEYLNFSFLSLANNVLAP